MSAKMFNRSMLILLAATFFYMTSLMMLGPIMAGYCGSLGGSAVVMGLVAGMSNFAALLCRPFVGPAVDRCDRRMIGLLGMASMLVGAAVSALASNVWVLMFGRLFTGAGFAISSGTLSTWVASSLPHEHIGQGMGLYGMVQPICQAAGIRSVPIDEHGVANCTYYIGLDLGLAFGPTLSGALYGAFGEQGLFLALAAVPALSIVVLAASKRVLDRLGL